MQTFACTIMHRVLRLHTVHSCRTCMSVPAGKCLVTCHICHTYVHALSAFLSYSDVCRTLMAAYACIITHDISAELVPQMFKYVQDTDGCTCLHLAARHCDGSGAVATALLHSADLGCDITELARVSWALLQPASWLAQFQDISMVHSLYV